MKREKGEKVKRENQRVQGLLMMEKGILLSRQQDAGSSLIPEGDAPVIHSNGI